MCQGKPDSMDVLHHVMIRRIERTLTPGVMPRRIRYVHYGAMDMTFQVHRITDKLISVASAVLRGERSYRLKTMRMEHAF